MRRTARTSNYSISRYLNIRRAYFPTFSSDGQRIAFITNITGVPQVWQVRLDYTTDDALWPDQLTFDADRVTGVWFSPAPGDGRLIYAGDLGGNENAQLYLLSADGSSETPLTVGYDEAMHTFGEWSRHGDRILFAANRRHPGLFDLYVQPLDDEAHLVWQNDSPGEPFTLTLSPDGQRAILVRTSSHFGHDLLEIDLMDGKARLLNPHGEKARFNSVCYSPSGRALILDTDLRSEFLQVARLDLKSLTLETLIGPNWDTELSTLSPDGNSLAYAINIDGADELHVCDIRNGSSGTAELGESPGVVSGMGGRLAFSPDSTRLAFSFTSATQTSDIFVWDLLEHQVRAVTRSSDGRLPLDTFISPKRISYATFDGRQVPAWYYEPKENDGVLMPAIVVAHGGPHGQFRPFLQDLIQYLVHHGYAVLAPNVRGSTGYGKTYGQLDDVEKRMDSVADLTHAVYWLKGRPSIDGDHLAVYGASYGGFMVLAALTNYPEVWSAGVDLMGISDFCTFLANTSEYRRAHREADYGSLTHDRAFLESISPINHLDRIAAPLLVIHGINDPRVPVSETEQLVEALKARAIPVECLIFEDEGHGLVKLHNKMVAYPAIVDFLDRHLRR